MADDVREKNVAGHSYKKEFSQAEIEQDKEVFLKEFAHVSRSEKQLKLMKATLKKADVKHVLSSERVPNVPHEIKKHP